MSPNSCSEVGSPTDGVVDLEVLGGEVVEDMFGAVDARAFFIGGGEEGDGAGMVGVGFGEFGEGRRSWRRGRISCRRLRGQ